MTEWLIALSLSFISNLHCEAVQCSTYSIPRACKSPLLAIPYGPSEIHTGLGITMFHTVRCLREFYCCAEMMNDNRDAVENAFKDGVISVLVATSTVATGVNLPAQRVIIRDNYTGLKENLLSVSRLRQMAGRAGRSGIDTKGECVCALLNTSVPALKRMKRVMTAPVCIP